MVSGEQINKSKSIQQQTGKTFYFATLLLPRRVRYATHILYAFFRIADEVVDINKDKKTYASEETLGDVVAVRSYKDSDKYEINYTFLNKIAKRYK